MCPSVNVTALVILLWVPVSAQWKNVTTRAAQKMNGPAPRAADGKPDLSGIWWVPDGSIEGIDAPPKYSLNLAADLDPAALGMLPWAQELMKQRQDNMRKDMPASRTAFRGPCPPSWLYPFLSRFSRRAVPL